MAEKIKLHPETPHQKQIFRIVDRLRSGEIIALPTDSRYALACLYSNKKGADRIRSIRNLKKDHLFTLICDSLNGVSRFTQLRDYQFKIIRRLIPGPFTFILPATKEVPRLLTHPSRKTIGIRVPENTICQKIMEELGEPLLTTTARIPDDGKKPIILDTDDLFRALAPGIDLFIDDEQPIKTDLTSIVDLTEEQAVIIREGMGVELLIDAFSLIDQSYVIAS